MREVIVKEYRNEQGLITRREIGQELVRCKECKHMDIYVDIDDDEYFCRIHNDDVRAYDFCSYGQKR